MKKKKIRVYDIKTPNFRQALNLFIFHVSNSKFFYTFYVKSCYFNILKKDWISNLKAYRKPLNKKYKILVLKNF